MEKKIFFKPVNKGSVRIVEGVAYKRNFPEQKQPFEATEQEWDLFLKGRGVFEKVDKPEKDKEESKPQTQTGGDAPAGAADSK
jgi:hypothetical protein